MKKIILLILLLFPNFILAFQTSARCTTVMDISNNRVIYEDNPNEIRSVASISKIMTAILAIESNKLNDVVTISDNIHDAYGSGIYIKSGEKIILKDLVYGLLLRSGNDAALAIAYKVSNNLNDFVDLMNKKAQELKMENTTFNNPSGLDGEIMKGNFSTSHDMAILMSYCMKNKIFRDITKTRLYKLKTNMNYYSWVNKNKLLKNYKYTTGGKTGFTKIAKRTLITTAKKNNTEFVIVTLNDGNDFLDHKNIYEEVFKIYKNYSIIKKGYIDIPDEEFYDNKHYYIKENFNYPLTKEEKNNVLVKYIIDEKYNYKNDDKIGHLEVYINNKKKFSTNIYINIKKKRIKIFDFIERFFK